MSTSYLTSITFGFSVYTLIISILISVSLMITIYLVKEQMLETKNDLLKITNENGAKKD